MVFTCVVMKFLFHDAEQSLITLVRLTIAILPPLEMTKRTQRRKNVFKGTTADPQGLDQDFQISILNTPSLSPAVQPQQDPPTLNLAVQEG